MPVAIPMRTPPTPTTDPFPRSPLFLAGGFALYERVSGCVAVAAQVELVGEALLEAVVVGEIEGVDAVEGHFGGPHHVGPLVGNGPGVVVGSGDKVLWRDELGNGSPGV